MATLILGIVIGSSLPRETEQPIAEMPSSPPDTLSEWQQLALAIIITESRADPSAVGRNHDLGVFQITPIFVAEANRISSAAFVHEDAFDIYKSLQMYGIIQDYYNPNHDVRKAIKVHNPGSSGIVYLQNLEMVRNLEVARALVKENI